MENDDEVTLDVQEEEQEDTVVETQGEDTTEEEKEEDNRVSLKMTPAEFRHYKQWKEEGTKPKEPVEQKATPTLDPIEAALLVGGMSKEVLGQLKKVSALTGKDLIESQTDPIFVAVKEKFEKDQKREEASLPASRGAGAVKAKKTFETPNLSREEHMAMVQAQL